MSPLNSYMHHQSSKYFDVPKEWHNIMTSFIQPLIITNMIFLCLANSFVNIILEYLYANTFQVMETLKNLDSNKGCGPDGIPATVLKDASETAPALFQ